jgi:autotransporter-associated beta strand protein
MDLSRVYPHQGRVRESQYGTTGTNAARQLNLFAMNLLSSLRAIFLTGTLVSQSALAVDATWLNTPLDSPNNDWNKNLNWNTTDAPNLSGDTATFSTSTVTSISTSASVFVNSITFASGASAFTITIGTPTAPASPLALVLQGTGVINNSSATQNFVTNPNASSGDPDPGSMIIFTNTASAGNAPSIIYTNNPITVPGTIPGGLTFQDSSTAGAATINNNAGTGLNAGFGGVLFTETSNAGTATISNGAGKEGTQGRTTFEGSSSAMNATLISKGAIGADDPSLDLQGGLTLFDHSSTAASATITLEGGSGGPSSGATKELRGGLAEWRGTATAGSATVTVKGGLSGGKGGLVNFRGNSTAGDAHFFLQAAQDTDPESVGGEALFTDSATAGTSDFNLTGGYMSFFDSSSAGSAALTADGGLAGGVNYTSEISFDDTATAGSATISMGDNTFLDFLGSSTAATSNILIRGNANTLGVGAASGTFYQNATAGDATIVVQGAAVNAITNDVANGLLRFANNSSAGTADITVQGGSVIGALGAAVLFVSSGVESATAGDASFTLNGGTGSGAQGGIVSFGGTSNAGTADFTLHGSGANATGGRVEFGGTASADHGEFIVNGGIVGNAEGALMVFAEGSTAGDAIITINGAETGTALPGLVQFGNNANAGNAIITVNGSSTPGTDGAGLQFFDTSSAQNATIITNGGTNGGFGAATSLSGNASGGMARVITNAGAAFTIHGLSSAGTTVGSIEGAGDYVLGSKNLTVGGLNTDTTVSGAIIGPAGGLTKTGTGTLTIAGVNNTYQGATNINAGTLRVNGSIATSSSVNIASAGTLAGTGRVSAISGSGAVSPGNSAGILRATQVNPSAGLDFTFEFTTPGSPNYANAAASGNDVLRLTNTTPFTLALGASNVITIDFSGATLASGQVYRGGFFTDASVDFTAMLSSATFNYVNTDGFAISFDGMVTEAMAAFASGTVVNGTVMEFTVIPEPAATLLLGCAGAALLLRRPGGRRRRDTASLS